MPKNTSVEQIWHRDPSGLYLPHGTHSDFSVNSSETYLQIKEKARSLEQLYKDSNIPLPSNCELARLIKAAKELSDAWLLNSSLPKDVLKQGFRAVHLSRIADAVLPLTQVAERGKYLSALTSGDLDFFRRTKSAAKNIFWELELWTALTNSGFDVALDEPDILINFGGCKLAIACKKIYSRRHVQNVLSQAVAQIEQISDFGIVAINIDDLWPENYILQAATSRSANNEITEFNNKFIIDNDRHFRKYLSSGRLLSALVSTAVLANIHAAKPSLNNLRRSSIWTIPGLAADKDAQLRRFYQLLMH